jgi:hypothetical protein
MIKDWRRRGGGGDAKVCSLRRAQCRRRRGGPRVRQMPLQGVRIRAVGAVVEMTGRGLVPRRLLKRIIPAWRIPPPLGGTRAARRLLRTGHSLIISGGTGPRLRAQACTLLASGRLWPPRRAHLHCPVAKARATWTCRSSRSRCWAHLRSTPVAATDLHRRSHCAPPPCGA